MNIHQLLRLTIDRGASDLHLVTGTPPALRINGELIMIPQAEVLNGTEIDSLVIPLLNTHQKEVYESTWELDFGLEFEGSRFRVNLYREKGAMAGAFRLIPSKIRTLEETGLPQVVSKITTLKQGLILITGPTGHGKTTSLASFINHINLTRKNHIITVEDPIEFVFQASKSIISQRELNSDTKSWDNALKAALREDPDVVLIGEMRDLDTIKAAITIAETGHLVFATLHTNSAAQTIDRVIDVFPSTQQPQIRSQFAAVIEAVISQRLIPTINPGRILSFELLFANPALRSVIREGKTHLIDNLIQTSGEAGMISMEACLATLVREGKITSETAHNFAVRPQVMAKLISG